MKTGPFHSLLAAAFVAAIAAGAPAMADEQPADKGSTPAEPKAAEPQPKPGTPASTTLQGLHLKLGNVELKVRGPVVLDTGANEAGSSKPDH